MNGNHDSHNYCSHSLSFRLWFWKEKRALRLISHIDIEVVLTIRTIIFDGRVGNFKLSIMSQPPRKPSQFMETKLIHSFEFWISDIYTMVTIVWIFAPVTGCVAAVRFAFSLSRKPFLSYDFYKQLTDLIPAFLKLVNPYTPETHDRNDIWYMIYVYIFNIVRCHFSILYNSMSSNELFTTDGFSLRVCCKPSPCPGLRRTRRSWRLTWECRRPAPLMLYMKGWKLQWQTLQRFNRSGISELIPIPKSFSKNQ